MCKGYYCGHLGKPSGQPSDTLRVQLSVVTEKLNWSPMERREKVGGTTLLAIQNTYW